MRKAAEHLIPVELELGGKDPMIVLKDADIHTIRAGEEINLGPFRIEFFQVCHSIPDGVGLGITTPAGLVVHTEKDVFFRIQKPKTVHWSIAWSDLMMTMFIFFVVLYVYQVGDRNLKFDPGSGNNTHFDAEHGKIVKPGKEPSQIYNQAKQAIMDEFVNGSNVELVKDKAVRIAFIATSMSVLGGVFGYYLGFFAISAIEPILHDVGYWDKYMTAQRWFEEWGFWAVVVAGFSPIPFKLFTAYRPFREGGRYCGLPCPYRSAKNWTFRARLLWSAS